jgi:hypothetical protein
LKVVGATIKVNTAAASTTMDFSCFLLGYHRKKSFVKSKIIDKTAAATMEYTLFCLCCQSVSPKGRMACFAGQNPRKFLLMAFLNNRDEANAN